MFFLIKLKKNMFLCFFYLQINVFNIYGRLYSDPESHNAQRYRQTDDTMKPIADHTMKQYDRLKRTWLIVTGARTSSILTTDRWPPARLLDLETEVPGFQGGPGDRRLPIVSDGNNLQSPFRAAAVSVSITAFVIRSLSLLNVCTDCTASVADCESRRAVAEAGNQVKPCRTCWRNDLSSTAINRDKRTASELCWPAHSVQCSIGTAVQKL